MSRETPKCPACGGSRDKWSDCTSAFHMFDLIPVTCTKHGRTWAVKQQMHEQYGCCLQCFQAGKINICNEDKAGSLSDAVLDSTYALMRQVATLRKERDMKYAEAAVANDKANQKLKQALEQCDGVTLETEYNGVTLTLNPMNGELTEA